jgi:FkbM family methyltransferase
MKNIKIYAQVRKNIIKIILIISSNINRKKWFKEYFNNRNKLRNWLYLYLYSSSMIIDIFLGLYKIWYGSGLKVLADYRNGMKLVFPALSSRYYGMFTDIVADQYINDYESYYKTEFKLKPNDVVIDVGAHIGKFSIPLLISNPEIQIYAFEPDVDNYACLKKNFELNSIDHSKCILFNGVLSDSTSDKSFSKGTYSTQGSIKDLGFSYQDENAVTYNVKSFTLEDIFQERKIQSCALLKLDCEGSEYLILESLSDDIFSKIHIIFMELHAVEGHSQASLIKKIKEQGFTVTGHKRDDGGMELFCVNEAVAVF